MKKLRVQTQSRCGNGCRVLLPAIVSLLFGAFVGLWVVLPVNSAQAQSKYPLYNRAKALCAQFEGGDVAAASALESMLDDLVGSSGSRDKDQCWAVFKICRCLATKLEADRERLERRIELLEIANDAAMETNLNNYLRNALDLGLAYIARGRLDAARRIFDESIPRLKSDDPKLPQFYRCRAQLDMERGDFDGSLRLLEAGEAGVVAGKPKAELNRLQILGVRGQVYLRMGVVDEAARWFAAERDMVSMLPASDRLVGSSWADRHHIELLLARESWDAAAREIDRVLDDYESLSGVRSELRLAKAVALLRLERLDATLAGTAEAILRDELERSASASVRQQARLRLADVLLRSGRRDEAELLVDAAARSAMGQSVGGSPRDAAFLASLEVRLGGDPEAVQRLRDAVLTMVGLWRDQATRAGGTGFLHMAYEHDALVEAMLAVRDHDSAAGGEHAAFELLLEAQSVGTLAKRLGDTNVTLEDLRRDYLAASEVIVVVLLGTDRSAIFAFDRHRLILEEGAGRREWKGGAIELVGAVAQSPKHLSDRESAQRSAILEREGRAIGAMLSVGALAEVVKPSIAVTLAMPEELGYFPLECVWLPGDSVPLGLCRAITYLPSFSVGAGLAQRADRRVASGIDLQLDMRFVLQPVRSRVLSAVSLDLPVLPFDDDDASRLTAPYARDRVEVITGVAASFDELARRDPSTAKGIHVIAHGVTAPERERRAGLLLSPSRDSSGDLDDGIVWVDKLETLRWPRLVFFGACGSASGPKRRGDSGASSLVGMLLAGGADCAVLPYLDVAYGATVALSETFHHAVVAGESPAQALLQARQALAASDRHADPYYHSLIHAWGLGNRPIHAKRTPAPAPRSARSGSFSAHVLWWCVAGALVVAAASWRLFRARR